MRNSNDRNSLFRLFQTCLLLWILAPSTHVSAQETLFSAEQPIRNIAMNEAGRLHLLTAKGVCELEGTRLVAACLDLEKDMQGVVPVNDGLYAVYGQQHLAIIAGGAISRVDSLPELITSAVWLPPYFYLGTAGKGLWRYSPEKGTQQPVTLEGRYVNDLCSADGSLWMALDDGVARWSPTDSLPEHFPMADILDHLAHLGDGQLLAVTIAGDLVRLDGRTGTELARAPCPHDVRELSASLGEAFFLSGDGCYAVGPELDVRKILPGSFTSLLAGQQVLLLADQNKLRSLDITIRERLAELPVYAIFSLSEKEQWAGTRGGVLHIRDGIRDGMVRIPTALPDISVTCIYADDRYLFAGTLGDGLFVFDRNGRLLRHFLYQTENNKNNIIGMRYADGLLWVAYLNGLSTLDPSTLELVDDYGSLLGNQYLYSFFPVKKGHFFIGTSGNGLLSFADGQVRNYLPGESVFALAPLGDSLLVGTGQGGLYAVTGDSLYRIADAAGIRQLHAAAEVIYVATGTGQYILDGHSLIPVPRSGGDGGDMQLNAVASSGRYLFAGQDKGWLIMDLGRLAALKDMRVHLNAPRLFNRPVAPDRYSFRYDEHSFSFSFHTRNYYPGGNNQFHYRLVGLDTSWQRTRENERSYYRLPPGKYRFEVIAGNVGEKMTKKPEYYAFEILPPFWRTWWFFGGVLIFLAAAVRWWVRFRERTILTREKRKREQIRFEFEQLKNQVDPHFLFNSLNSLIGLIEEDPASAVRATQSLSSLYRNILKYEKVELVPVHVELELAREYFAIHQLRYEDRIRLDIQVPKDVTGKLVPLSCQFLIENAIKHNVINAGHHLVISIALEGDYLCVKNNRRQRTDGESSHSGIGLANLKERYRLLSSKPVLVEATDHDFQVKIPIIHD